MNDLIGHLYSLGVTINRKLPVANVLQILRQCEIPPICKTVTLAGLHTWSEHTAVGAGGREEDNQEELPGYAEYKGTLAIVAEWSPIQISKLL